MDVSIIRKDVNTFPDMTCLQRLRSGLLNGAVLKNDVDLEKSQGSEKTTD